MPEYRAFNYIALFLLILSAPQTYGGFIAGTLVKTPTGYTNIEELHVYDKVMCYDTTENRQQSRPILSISKKTINPCIRIKLCGQHIITSYYQQFYSESLQEWLDIPAIITRHEDSLFSIDDIYLHEDSTELYEITVEEFHNFFITTHDILVHNFVPLLSLAPAITQTAIIQSVATAGCSLVGVLFGIRHLKRRSKNQHQSYQAFPQPPPEDPDKEKKNNNDKNDEVKIPEEAAPHIFRQKEGHFSSDTPANRQSLLDLASNEKNFLGIDRYGTTWYGKILQNGQQLWARVRNNLITDGGLNKIPRSFNPETGLCRLTPSRGKK